MSMKDMIFKELKKEFPVGAYDIDVSRGQVWFTSLRAYEVVNRLNEVLGIDGWDFETSFEKQDDGFLAFLKLNIYLEGRKITKSAVGFAARDGFRGKGDVCKAAQTAALSKAASYFGVGCDVYRGLIDVKSLPGYDDAYKRFKAKYPNKEPIIRAVPDLPSNDEIEDKEEAEPTGTNEAVKKAAETVKQSSVKPEPEKPEPKQAEPEDKRTRKPKPEPKQPVTKAEPKPEPKPEPEKPAEVKPVSEITRTRIKKMTESFETRGASIVKVLKKKGLPSLSEINDENWIQVSNVMRVELANIVTLVEKKKEPLPKDISLDPEPIAAPPNTKELEF